MQAAEPKVRLESIKQKLIRSAHDVPEDGLFVTLVDCVMASCKIGNPTTITT